MLSLQSVGYYSLLNKLSTQSTSNVVRSSRSAGTSKKASFFCVFFKWKKTDEDSLQSNEKASFWPYESTNKKDGYRQQNVRQRQKLISIIDYDVCIFCLLYTSPSPRD